MLETSAEQPFEESEIEYEALRNTALHCEDAIRNARTYMYVVYFALFAFAFDTHWLFVVSLLILIFFQSMINSEKIAIQRVSTYIRVFFEERRDDMHWSTLNKDEDHLKSYRPQYQDLGWHINIYGATILAFVSVIAYAFSVTYAYNFNLCLVDWTEWVGFLVSLLCFGVVFHVNVKSYNSGRTTRVREIASDLDENVQIFHKRLVANNESSQ